MKIQRPLYKVSLALFALLISSLGIAQTGPAGVRNNSTNKYWLDAHALNLSDGAEVSIWNDLSGNGDDFVQTSSDRFPTLSALGIGGLPAVNFDGVNDVLIASPNAALESSAVTYFLVYDRIGTASGMIINGDYDSDFRKWRSYSNPGQNRMISGHFSPSFDFIFFDDPGPASFFSTHYSPTEFSTFSQGVLEASDPTTYTIPVGHNATYLGNRSATATSSYTYRGLVSEVITYNAELNELERILIENYLGAKYNMAIPTDLYDYESTHRLGLIALADDGTNSQTTAQGAGVLFMSGASELAAGEHFIVANTDFSLSSFNTVDLPLVELPMHQRFERTWRVDESGEVGTVNLIFGLGEDDFAVPDSYRLLVDADGIFADATIIPGVYDAGSASLSFTVNLSDGDFFTLSGIQEILEIHSITDGLWSQESTWDCSCIPSASDLVFIDPATTVTGDIDGFVDDLTVSFGGTLIMNSPVTIDINGDWTISGTTDFTDGAISLTGDVSQTVTIASTSPLDVNLNNLIINNTIATGNVTFQGGGRYLLNGVMSPNAGNIIIDPGTNFVVTSTSSTQSGSIGPIITPTTITGNFIVQRMIPPGVAEFRNLCSPVLGNTFDDWDPDLAMSGPDFPDGCAFGPDGCFISVMAHEGGLYDPVISSSEAIENGTGFELFVGTDLVTFSGTTLNSPGPLNNSSNIVKTIPTGFALIGNPYASVIDFKTVDRTSQIGNYFFVYDANIAGFQFYDGITSTSSIPSLLDGYVSSGQGFWVFASSLGSLTFKQSDKTSETTTFLRTSSTVNNSLEINIKQNDQHYQASIFVEEYSDANDSFDEFMDIAHLYTGIEKAPSFAIESPEMLLRKNFIKPNGKDKSFKLNTAFVEDGNYTLSAKNIENFSQYHKILLFDSKNGQMINLKENDYMFYAQSAEKDAEFGINDSLRFTLILSNSNESNATSPILSEINSGNDLSIKQMGNIIEITSTEDLEENSIFTVTNVLGQKEVFSEALNLTNGSNLVTLPSRLQGSGVLIISVRTGTNVATKKIIL